MTRRRLCVLSLLMMAQCAIASDDVELTEDYTYFSVYPESVDDLGPALMAAAKRLELGGATIAETESRHDWQIKMLEDSGGCRIERASVKLDVIYRLPKVVSDDADVRAEWDVLYPRILKHERHHKDIALDASRQILAALSALPAAEDCDALVENANTVAEQIHEQERIRQQQFDRRTNGGEIEGVIRFEVSQ